MNKLRGFRSNMSKNVIGGLVALLLLFGIVVCAIGTNSISTAFKNEYAMVTYHMADSATVFVNGDHIEEFLANKRREEYSIAKMRLDTCCQKLNVSIIYVIRVDTSDYGSFVSVFNSINNELDNTSYTEWPLGYERQTTNDEYRAKYRELYEQRADYETVFRLRPGGGIHPHLTTMVPVKNSEGEVTALLCIQRPIREIISTVRPYNAFILISALAMMVLVSVLAATFLRQSVIAPIRKVTEESTRFAREHTKGAPIGELSKYDIIRKLSGSIDSMETDMVNYIENLTAVTAEKERIGAELSIAATIQEDALPDVFPAFPDRHEFDIYAIMDPAKEVGGDFYNYFFVDDDHLALVMADVSGKGVPAALFMMVTNVLISMRTRMGGTPAEILAYMNNSICEHNRASMFLTAWLGILEISTGRLIAANAGHEYPAICRRGGEFEVIREKHGFVLGGMEDMRYRDQEYQLHRGDKLFLYTDGLPEATDHNNQMFSLDRMVQALNEFREESPQAILDGVLKRVDAFVGDAPQFDDLTMLCFEFKAEGEGRE